MDDRNVILKDWRGSTGCPKNLDGRHWAYYVFQDNIDKEYWLDEHTDEINQVVWRHYEFMSIPCAKCGAYSPLRCSNQFSNNIDGSYDEKSCPKGKIVDYHLDDALPDSVAYYRENGWLYAYFKETLSDSICGQETFKLKRQPTDAGY